jgi:DNA-directed RNA polymerase sigma subunit (sigma70/sigma32)
MKRKQTVNVTEVKTQTLTPIEEKVVRMRFGLAAPDSLVLERVGQDKPEIAAKLAELEQRALSAVGPHTNPAKRKIVNALRRTNRT